MIRKLTIQSPLPVSAVDARIRAAVRPRLDLWAWLLFKVGIGRTPGLEFVGRVDGDRFTLRGLTVLRSSYLAVLHGRIAPAPQGGGSVLSVLMRPHAVVLALRGFSFGLLTIGILVAFARTFAEGRVPGVFAFVVAGAVIGMMPLLTAVQFHHIANGAERSLRRSLDRPAPASKVTAVPDAATAPSAPRP